MKRILCIMATIMCMFTLVSCGSKSEIYKNLKDVDSDILSDAVVYYTANGNLYSAARDGSFSIQIAGKVKEGAIIRGNAVFFVKKTADGWFLAKYSHGDNDYSIFEKYEVPYIYTDGVTGNAYAKLATRIPDTEYGGPDYDKIEIKNNGQVSKIMGVKDENGNYKDVHEEEKLCGCEEASINGWKITAKSGKLTFYDGSNTTKVSGKNMFFIGIID